MLEKKSIIDKIEVLEDGVVQVRRADIVCENGVELGKTYNRHCLSPADSLEGEDARVAAIAQAAWTPEVITAYLNKVSSGE